MLIGLLGLYSTLTGQLAETPGGWPRLADYMPAWWPAWAWLVMALLILLLGSLEGAFRLIATRDREIARLTGTAAHRVGVAKRAIVAIEVRLLTLAEGLADHDRRELASEAETEAVLAARAETKEVLARMLAAGRLSRVLGREWEQHGRIIAPPRRLLVSLANNVRALAESLEEHDLLDSWEAR